MHDLFLLTGDFNDMYTNIQHQDVLDAFDDVSVIDRATPRPILTPRLRQFLSNAISFILTTVSENPRLDTFGNAEASQWDRIVRRNSRISLVLRQSFLRSELESFLHSCCMHATSHLLAVGTLSQLQQLPNLQIYPPQFTIRFGAPSKSVDFLDLHISIQNDSLRLRTHQKDVNAYLYPHAESNIPPSIKKGFIKGELIRYTRNSSLISSYSLIKQCFFARLLSRGYRLQYLERISRSVCFALRQEYLRRSVNLPTVNNPLLPNPRHFTSPFSLVHSNTTSFSMHYHINPRKQIQYHSILRSSLTRGCTCTITSNPHRQLAAASTSIPTPVSTSSTHVSPIATVSSISGQSRPHFDHKFARCRLPSRSLRLG